MAIFKTNIIKSPRKTVQKLPLLKFEEDELENLEFGSKLIAKTTGHCWSSAIYLGKIENEDEQLPTKFRVRYLDPERKFTAILSR